MSHVFRDLFRHRARRITPSAALTAAALTATLTLAGCSSSGAGQSAPTPAGSSGSSGSSHSDASASGDPSPSASGSLSAFQQTLEVKQALSHAAATTGYAHARIRGVVAKGGGFTASGRLDLLSSPERFRYAVRFDGASFNGTYVGYEGKVYTVAADGTPTEMSEATSRFLFYWLNPMAGANALDADLETLVSTDTEVLGGADTTHYLLKGVQHPSDGKVRFTMEVWLDTEGHVVKRIATLPDITVTMLFDSFDEEVTIDKPGGSGTAI